MKTYILNLKDKDTSESIHSYLAAMLDLPEHYGRNLDALYDCLTSCTAASDINIVNIDHNNDLHKRILNVFTDAANDNHNLHLHTQQSNWIA